MPSFQFKPIFIMLWIILFISACGTATGTESSEEQTLTVMTHDSFSISEEVLNKFQDEHGVQVRFLKSGDTGTAVNKAILAKDKPLADLFYGVDNTFLSRVLDEDIFEPYQSALLSDIPDDFKLDQQYTALPVDYGDVCLNYDISYFDDQDFPPPQSLEDLRAPQYKDLLVVENPATSSPGLAFLLATIGHFGDPGYLEYWESLVANNVLVVNDWEVAYYQEFTRAGGMRPIVVSYGSSPPFEIIYAQSPIEEPPTAAVVSDGACFRQIEFVGILNGTQNREMAEEWVDFMLSPAFQEEIPLQMFVFPVNENAILDDTFMKYLAVPDHPAVINPEDIAANRETWIKDWTEAVLR